MKKKLILLVLIISVIFIIGCAQEDELVSGPFIGGTNGLEIEFVNNEPPDKVFDNNEEDFDITIRVENVGEFDILSNKVISTLSGIDTLDFGIGSPNKVLNFGLEGKEEFNGKAVNGEEGDLIYSDAKYKFDLGADFETVVRADVCYEYKTAATTKACIRRKATERDTSDACSVNNENVQVENSGAPVQIEQVSTRTSGTNEVRLSFLVRNVASGIVYPPNTFSGSCGENDDKEDRLNLEVRIPSGRYKIICNQLGGAFGEIKLIDNEKAITCRISTSSAPENPVEAPINIVASYFYRNAIQKTLIVEDSEDI